MSPPNDQDRIRRYDASERRSEALERAVHGLEAISDIAIAISAERRLDRVLELIADRGRALVDAQSMLIMLRDGADLVIAAAAGNAVDVHGLRLPIGDSTAGRILEAGRPERIADVESRLRISPTKLGVPNAHTGLLVPMIHRGEALGVLALFDHGDERDGFTEYDERLMRAFAATAANAVVVARSVEASRLRSAIGAADAERARWARDLHDQTLQSLGGLSVLLAGAFRRAGSPEVRELLSQAIDDTDQEIANVRAMISDLRPSVLDDFGLLPALEALLARRGREGLRVESELVIPSGDESLDPELETTIYRVIQESIANVVRHAHAHSVRVAVHAADGEVTLEVQDDGIGFNARAHAAGFGVLGMRERVYLAGGTMTIQSGARGTVLRARLGDGSLIPD